METMSRSRVWLRMRLAAARLLNDSSGIAATEFAVIVPIMLVIFFGTVEISSGVAVDRKVTLVARTLSDLTSQAPPPTQSQPWSTVDDTYLQNVFTASIAILQSYPASPSKVTLSEIYVDSNKIAKIQWSKAATFAGGATQATLVASSRNAGDVVTSTVPPALLVKQTYLIFSEVSYLYTPAIGYVMAKSGVTLGDVAYTRPRQVVCVVYNNLPNVNGPPPGCPML
jgi:Flp pilus assembly protein TadG